MADIFISYAREDRTKAQQLAAALEDSGWSVWWDTRLKAGEIWDEVIEKEIKTARTVVVLWSHASVNSRCQERSPHCRQASDPRSRTPSRSRHST
jgi:hypothetical protein